MTKRGLVARAAVLAALGSVLSGCINSSTLVRLKPDGSGTVEQTMLVNMAAVKGMMGGLDPATAAKAGTAVNEADLKRQAERMGGLELVSAEPIKGANGFEGTKAIFAFKDINQLRVDQDPNLSGTTGGAMGAPPANSSPVVFKLARTGGSSVLTVSFPEAAAPKTVPDMPAGAPPEINPQMMAMVKTMTEGFRIGIDLEVAGSIVKTNADHVSGSRITLLEMNMGEILAQESVLKDLQTRIKPGASLADVKPYLKGIKGLKVNDPVVTVEFR